MLISTAGRDQDESSPWESRRLWSLWDIMRSFHPWFFIGIAVCAGGLYRDFTTFPRKYGKWWWNQRMPIWPKDRKEFDELYESVESQCRELELRAAQATVKKMRACLAKPWSRYGQFFALGPELYDRLYDEMQERVFLAIPPQEAELFENPSKGWENVVKQFPGAVYDIEEAARCLALDRSTASAFHGIRCLEAAIRALARCLGIPDPTRAVERNWGKALDAIKNVIDRRWPTSTQKLTGDGQLFDSAYAALAAMQNPWRNATMHLDQKYTPEEARHIFEIVKGFMARLASRMDENGDPKA